MVCSRLDYVPPRVDPFEQTRMSGELAVCECVEIYMIAKSAMNGFV